MRNMRSATEIDKLTLSIETERFVICQAGLDVLDLQFLVEVIAEFDGLITPQGEPFEWLGFLDDFALNSG